LQNTFGQLLWMRAFGLGYQGIIPCCTFNAEKKRETGILYAGLPSKVPGAFWHYAELTICHSNPTFLYQPLLHFEDGRY
jgi:hypothetical protein